MCKTDALKGSTEERQHISQAQTMPRHDDDSAMQVMEFTPVTTTPALVRQRRGKRVKESDVTVLPATMARSMTRHTKSASTTSKHPKKGTGGAVVKNSSSPLQVMLPSLIGVVILGVAVMAKMGFRGRPTVAGIDLGTTNSVICVQEQKADVVIHCIRDPATNSPIIPSVVSFLPNPFPAVPTSTQQSRQSSSSAGSSKDLKLLPDNVVVGTAAKERIATHPHTTIYHAKRILGRSVQDPAVATLQSEVEFRIDTIDDDTPVFMIPELYAVHKEVQVSPVRVGEYVIRYLRQLVVDTLLHDTVRTAVICVPAQFNQYQRLQTVMAVTAAGFTVSRVLEEPVAAALAYGLHRAQGTIFVLVYDFGGGTLDVSVLQLSGSDYVDVLNSDGDDLLGGSNFDSAIADHLRQKFLSSDSGLAIIESDLEEQVMDQCQETHKHFCTIASLHVIGEEFKIGLSDLYGDDTATILDDARKQELVVTNECLTVSADQQRPDETTTKTDMIRCDELISVPLHLSLYDFEKTVAAPLLDRAIRPIHRVLEAVAMDYTDIDEVVMVGGTTRMPIVRQLVHAALPHAKLNTHIDPDITVAYGAASVMD